MYNKTHIVFRPPFINGRPQDSNSVFWALVLVFSFSPSFLKRDYQPLPGITEGRSGETEGDQGSTRPLLGHRWATIGPPLGHCWPIARPKNIFGDMGL